MLLVVLKAEQLSFVIRKIYISSAKHVISQLNSFISHWSKVNSFSYSLCSLLITGFLLHNLSLPPCEYVERK